ncbi:MAG: hypothetical protein QM706_04945 [Nitrospira sp.]
MKLPDHIYHLAEAANWPSIQRQGLLSASQLITAAGVIGNDRDRLERTQRVAHIILPSGVQIRDQKPMSTRALERCLVDLTPPEWYRLINNQVFFWLDPERLNRQKAACEPRPQVVIVLDTATLVAAYGEHVALTPFNTGNARRNPARRSAATFVPIAEWVKSGWLTEAHALGSPLRNRSHRPVELTVLDAVPDLMRFVVDVVRLEASHPFVPKAKRSMSHHKK